MVEDMNNSVWPPSAVPWPSFRAPGLRQLAGHRGRGHGPDRQGERGGHLRRAVQLAGELSENGDEIWALVAQDYTAISAYSFMIFNLLCAPCFAAMGAIKREMNNAKWTAFAIGYMCVFAYVVSPDCLSDRRPHHRRGLFGIGTVVAVVLVVGIVYLLFRKNKYEDERLTIPLGGCRRTPRRPEIRKEAANERTHYHRGPHRPGGLCGHRRQGIYNRRHGKGGCSCGGDCGAWRGCHCGKYPSFLTSGSPAPPGGRRRSISWN